jgi:hypothetical protein
MPVEAIASDGAEGASDAGPTARVPSSSTKLNAHGDAEGAFGVRPPACIPNMNINV